MMIQQHELLKTHSVDNGPGLISSEESVALSGVEQHQTDKLRAFLAKLNPVCQSNSVKNWMDLACCGEAALAVYKDVKAALERWIPLRRLEEALTDSKTEAGRENELSALKCCCCSGLIMDPVCFPCGHSTCKTCIDKLPSPPLASEQQGKMVECPQCRQPWSVHVGSGERRRHPTVLVTRLWNKHLTAQHTAAGLKEKGNTYATEGDYLRAVESYSQSLMAGTGVLYIMRIWFGCAFAAQTQSCTHQLLGPAAVISNLSQSVYVPPCTVCVLRVPVFNFPHFVCCC